MSLINDALKRTKDAQQQNPPPAGGPALKPADHATSKAAGNSKSLLYIMVACAVLGNAFIFLYYFSKDRDKKANVPTVSVATPAAAILLVAPPPPPAKVEVAPAPVAVETNAAAPVIAAPPEALKLAPLKLQSIIFNPARPSAMISGKFVFIGDKVQGFRVTAIDQESVTLAGNGETNILSLP